MHFKNIYFYMIKHCYLFLFFTSLFQPLKSFTFPHFSSSLFSLLSKISYLAPPHDLLLLKTPKFPPSSLVSSFILLIRLSFPFLTTTVNPSTPLFVALSLPFSFPRLSLTRPFLPSNNS